MYQHSGCRVGRFLSPSVLMIHSFTHNLRLHLVGAKRKLSKRRNFKFGKSTGYDDVFTQNYFVRVILVKIPRFCGGEIIEYDLYDMVQSKSAFCQYILRILLNSL